MKTKLLPAALLAGLFCCLPLPGLHAQSPFEALRQRLLQGRPERPAATEPAGQPGTRDAQLPRAVTAEQVKVEERGPHSQRVEVVRELADEQGGTITVTNSYVQLESGLNYRNEQGEWVASEPKFEITAEGVTAWKGQHRVSLAGNLDTQGAVQLRLPDGRLIEGHVVGLAYYDAATGESVLFAPMKASDGWLMADNQVVYPDAFEGTQADVRYTYQRHGFAQDIILRATPPDPAKYGLDPATTRLEVWTEFTQTPEPELRAAEGAVPESADQTVDFGSMQIGEGRAFVLGEEKMGGVPMGGVPVRKRWVKSEQNRTFLIEAVDLPAVAAELEQLPAPPEEASVRPARAGSRWQALNALPVKPRNTSAETAMLRPTQDHQLVAAYRQPGFVVDYQVISANTNNFTFRSDTTYYVTGNYSLGGTTTLEGGTVIKYPKYVEGSVDARLYVTGSFVSKTSRFRPAVFTAKDDDSVGEIISGSTGNPGTDLYANVAFRFWENASLALEHVRFHNAVNAASFHSANSNSIVNAQFVNCKFPVSTTGAGPAGCYNVLIDNVLAGGYAFYGKSNLTTIYAEHVTIHKAPNLRLDTAMSFKNSLLVQVTNVQSYTNVSSSNVQLSSGAGVFQSAGYGHHYLAAGSPYRNAGITGIDPTLAAELRTLTTHPPLVVSNAVTTATTWSPQAFRDVDTPDLGYHYPPLDYVVRDVAVEAPLRIDGGVVVAADGGKGLAIEHLGADTPVVTIWGRPEALATFCRVRAVQERPPAQSAANPEHTIFGGNVLARFARFILDNPAHAETAHFDDENDDYELAFLWDCQFHGGRLKGPAVGEEWLFNCLLDRVRLKSEGDGNTSWVIGYFLTLREGELTAGTDGWVDVYDSILWNVTHSVSNQVTSAGNAYIGTTVLPGSGGGDQTGLVADFASGPLGDYYLPASGGTNSLATLRNAGSDTADNLYLYHHATDAAQNKEGTSQADLGFHYLATETHLASGGFSSTQGLNGWWYMHAPLQGAANGYLTNYSGTYWYNWTTGNDQYCRIWSNGNHPGDNYDNVRRFVSPRDGRVWLSGTASDTGAVGTDGVYARISWNSYPVTAWHYVPNAGSTAITAAAWVRAGDTLDFQINEGVNNGSDSTGWDPRISYDTPKDTDGDGLPDWWEDVDANGAVDANPNFPWSGVWTQPETDWQTYNSPNQVGSGGLAVFSPVW